MSDLSLEDFEAHFEAMKQIEETVAYDAVHGRLPSIMEVTNPGSSKAHAQGRPGLSVDQTTSSSISSASIHNSDGQGQTLDLHPGQQGVAVTPVSQVSTRISDGRFQSRNYHPLDQGMNVTPGPAPGVRSPLPTNINVNEQNLHRAPHATADTSPIAIDIDAGRRKVGGLAESINIK